MKKSQPCVPLLVFTNVLSSVALYLLLWKDVQVLLSTAEGEPTTPRPAARQEPPITESFVISFDPTRVSRFEERNYGLNASWVPGVDGFHQPTLDLWARLSGQYPFVLNASLFDRQSQEDKDKYKSPHAVGCYMAHWNLIRTLASRPVGLRPDLYLVFEDDASCIPNLVNATLEVVKKLPSDDWDLFYIGGKPFTYFPSNHTRNPFYKDSTNETLLRDVCRGAFGTGSSPLYNDGRILSESSSQPFWRVIEITNTHSYVINPKRIERLLHVLQPRAHLPIDIALRDAMRRGDLTAYMPTRAFCKGDSSKTPLSAPISWKGWFRFPLRAKMHPALRTKNTNGYWWHRMQVDNCSY